MRSVLRQPEKNCAEKIRDMWKRADSGGQISGRIPQKRRYEAMKRGFDIVFSLLALVLLSPVLLLLCVAIVLDEPLAGPIYVSWRVGRHGELFKFYKLRSMRADAEAALEELLECNEADGPAFKMKEDPRITRIGRVLRKYSLDELPQLINVLRGDMSIVGPRPPIPREVEMYSCEQMKRLAIRPGLTCYWQVQPKRNDMSFDEWVQLDVRYIHERSLGLDMRLIFSTIGVMMGGEGI